MSREARQKSKDKHNLNRLRYQGDVEPQVRFNHVYVTLMAVSGVLASVAFLVNSIPILIGSMVVAPVMPPMVLMAISLVNKDLKATGRGLWVSVCGLLIALVFAVATTWLLSITGINPAQLQLEHVFLERVQPGWNSFVAALAAGIAGALAVSHRRQDTLVGVVASVALVPSVAASGISVMIGDWSKFFGGLSMLGINVGMIVVMGWLFFNFFSVSGE